MCAGIGRNWVNVLRYIFDITDLNDISKNHLDASEQLRILTKPKPRKIKVGNVGKKFSCSALDVPLYESYDLIYGVWFLGYL